MAKKRHNPILEHNYCPVEVRYVTDPTIPHKAYLYCTQHQQYVQWLSKDLAGQWEVELAARQ